MDARNRPPIKFDALVKARIRPDQKRALEAIARRRHLDLSDVLRDAFGTYLRMLRENKAEQREPADAL
jgi:hypothetical protein